MAYCIHLTTGLVNVHFWLFICLLECKTMTAVRSVIFGVPNILCRCSCCINFLVKAEVKREVNGSYRKWFHQGTALCLCVCICVFQTWPKVNIMHMIFDIINSHNKSFLSCSLTRKTEILFCVCVIPNDKLCFLWSSDITFTQNKPCFHKFISPCETCCDTPCWFWFTGSVKGLHVGMTQTVKVKEGSRENVQNTQSHKKADLCFSVFNNLIMFKIISVNSTHHIL